MDILEFAMEKEQYSEQQYRQLAQRTPNKGFQNILTMLADEEVHHYQIIQKMKNDISEQVRQTNLLSDAKEIFQKMKDSAEKLNFDTSEIELYQKAQKIEQQSRDYYLEKAYQLAGNDQKQIFLSLAEEEKKHYFLLQNIIDFVAQPETWLENAEFNNLEDY
ncbi:MAG: ferritin family protein [Planctomycetota bacterium]|jgi:rubrerythrin